MSIRGTPYFAEYSHTILKNGDIGLEMRFAGERKSSQLSGVGPHAEAPGGVKAPARVWRRAIDSS
ncbi:MAG: hypothetical protein ACYTFQ_09485, partial [Planctomycetota bacterium]